MAYQVLSTKLYIPPIQVSLVRRPRLVKILESGYQAGKRVTVVSAPAGFGKTTLIREWITDSALEKPYGWLSLDDGDNDPVRFMVYLISAIQQVNPDIGQTILAALNSTQIPSLPDLVESLLNEISIAKQPFLIVLDDYHLIKNIEVHSMLQLLLKRQPECLHLVLITREDPPFSLPRMRVQGLLAEIRERDLRFTIPEAQDFLLRTMGLDLSPQEVDKLEERTEGWAVGMQLAGLALEEFTNDHDRRAFIEAFNGSNRMIADYLISEVLQRQTEVTRRLLLSTSILERFCAELCDSIIFDEDAVGNSQAMLENLEQSNMFLVPLDNRRHWYRYHHLFSEMLFHTLRRQSPDQIPELYRKASRWFEKNGFIPEAMKHAIASKDWDFVTNLLNIHALPMTFQGFGGMVIEWCSQIPKSHLEKSPDICIHYAWVLVLTFRNDLLDAVEEQIQIASRIIESSDLPEYARVGEGQTLVPYRDWIIGQICVLRSQILLARFNTFVDPQELIALSQKGLELLPEAERTFRSLCMINLAHAELMQNNPVEAQQAFEKALPFMLAAGNFLGSVADLFYQARLSFYMGNPARTEKLCLEWKQKFTEMAAATGIEEGQPTPEIPAARGLDIVQGMLLLERGQLAEAESLFVKSLELLGWGSWMELHGFIELARLRFACGNESGAQEVLQRMSRMGLQHSACAEALEILFAVRKSPDDPQVRSQAVAWTKGFTLDPAAPFALGIGPYHRDAEYLCNLSWAQVQVALGYYQEAEIFLCPALRTAKDRGLLFREAELSIVHALSLEGQCRTSEAMVALRRALEISETCGYTRFFDDSLALDRLLEQAVVQDNHTGYAKRLMALFSFTRLSTDNTGDGKVSSPLADPLSERESEVLVLLASGLPTKEIAKKLFLSPFTLKAHTQNIYSKLDVHSRIEAVNKARELGLL